MFQALTGCQDRERALFFLKGAGDDLSIAVNHFLTALEQAEVSNPSSPPSGSAAVENAAVSADTKGATHDKRSQERSQEKSQSRSGGDSSAPLSSSAAASASSSGKENDSTAFVDDFSGVDDMVVEAGTGGGADVRESLGEDRGGAAIAQGVSEGV